MHLRSLHYYRRFRRIWYYNILGSIYCLLIIVLNYNLFVFKTIVDNSPFLITLLKPHKKSNINNKWFVFRCIALDRTSPKLTLSLSLSFSVSVLFSWYNFSYLLLHLQVAIIVKTAMKANMKNMLDWFQNTLDILFWSYGYKLKEIKIDYLLSFQTLQICWWKLQSNSRELRKNTTLILTRFSSIRESVEKVR